MKRMCVCFWVHHSQCLTVVLCSIISLFNLSNISRQKQQTTAALWARDILRWETPSLQTSQQHMISAWMQETHTLTFIFTHHTCICTHPPTHFTLHLKQHISEINKGKKMVSENDIWTTAEKREMSYCSTNIPHRLRESCLQYICIRGSRFLAVIHVSWPPLKTNVQNACALVCTLITVFCINSKGLAVSSNYRQTYHVM